MAVDTSRKRFSMMAMVSSPLLGITKPLFVADGEIGLGDRQHLLGLYSGIDFETSAAPTPVFPKLIRKTPIAKGGTMVRKYE